MHTCDHQLNTDENINALGSVGLCETCYEELSCMIMGAENSHQLSENWRPRKAGDISFNQNLKVGEPGALMALSLSPRAD